MALPQRVLEGLRDDRDVSRLPGWSGQMLMFATTIFLIVLFIYLGIMFGYRPYLNSSVAKLNTQIQAFSQQVPESDQKNIINFYSELANTKTLLEKHAFSSNLFDWLEKNTQVNVSYTRLVLTLQNNQVVLSGMAKTIPDLAQQLQIFQEKDEVQRISVSNVTVSQTGTWQFDLTLFFKPSFFKAPATH